VIEDLVEELRNEERYKREWLMEKLIFIAVHVMSMLCVMGIIIIVLHSGRHFFDQQKCCLRNFSDFLNYY